MPLKWQRIQDDTSKKLSELRNKSYQQFQELKKHLEEQSKEIEILKRNQIKLLDIKNILQEFKN